MRVETKEEEQEAIGPERAQTPEPARLNAKMLRRDKRLLMEGKEINMRVATSLANMQVQRTFYPTADHSSPQSIALETQVPPALCPPEVQGASGEEEAAGTPPTWASTLWGPSNQGMKN